MQDYYAPLPVDQFGESMQDFPTARPSKARYASAPSVSSVMTLTDNTTTIEIATMSPTSGGGGIAIKWIASSDTAGSVIATGATANFDNVVPSNWRQRFAVPQEKQGVQSIVGANIRNGLYNRVAWISTGAPVSSVWLTEY